MSTTLPAIMAVTAPLAGLTVPVPILKRDNHSLYTIWATRLYSGFLFSALSLCLSVSLYVSLSLPSTFLSLPSISLSLYVYLSLPSTFIYLPSISPFCLSLLSLYLSLLSLYLSLLSLYFSISLSLPSISVLDIN